MSFQANAQLNYTQQVQLHRDTTNSKFADSATSILTNAERLLFDGLDYFDIDSNYRIKAIFKENRVKKEFEMITSTDRKPVYNRFGTLTFMIDSQTFVLNIYQNTLLSKNPKFADYLFCPFKDLTNGNETYGGGRYLDFKISELKSNPVIDFNYCYNPYCNYNYKYSCPVPPHENHLNVEIKAGIMAYTHKAE